MNGQHNDNRFFALAVAVITLSAASAFVFDRIGLGIADARNASNIESASAQIQALQKRVVEIDSRHSELLLKLDILERGCSVLPKGEKK